MYGFLELLKEKKLNNFNYDLLKEGLIRSAEYDFAIIKINDLLLKHNIKGFCELYVGKDRITLILEEDNIYKRKSFYVDFESLLNNLGYYISNYKINNNALEKGKISFTDFIKNKNILIYLNKKFDNEFADIPEFLYHVTEEKYIDKINIKGIVPKSKKYIEGHPERIYFFLNVDDCYDFIDFKELKDFVILKIDVKTLNNIKLHEDPKFVPYVKAYYTYENIPPYSIIKIEKL